ncbi:nicotinate-nucleotide--dimethylbenzimidazole phosphoribosyltransferase [Streptomyces sp. NPDC005962]|uniref:nicotinate-nucleotide--dimethylbenzimidazole phosphoribosyltransferase n=1 Tax=Streptomyces sp. NPDC005962 TaxID=3154466 RepID=UPI0034004AAA
MTDTGQVPGEGLPENAGGRLGQPHPADVHSPPADAGYIEQPQPGVVPGAGYPFLDGPETGGEEDDLLLMPGAQGAWSEQQAQYEQQMQAMQNPMQTQYPQQPDYGMQGMYEGGVLDPGMAAYAETQMPEPQPVAEPLAGPVEHPAAEQPAPQPPAHAAPPTPARRPLHMGPPVPDHTSGGGIVRSLADRGPAAGRNTAPPVQQPPQAPPPEPEPEYTGGADYASAPEYAAGPQYFATQPQPQPQPEDSGTLPGPQLADMPQIGDAPPPGDAWDPQPPPAPLPAPAETVGLGEQPMAMDLGYADPGYADPGYADPGYADPAVTIPPQGGAPLMEPGQPHVDIPAQIQPGVTPDQLHTGPHAVIPAQIPHEDAPHLYADPIVADTAQQSPAPIDPAAADLAAAEAAAAGQAFAEPAFAEAPEWDADAQVPVDPAVADAPQAPDFDAQAEPADMQAAYVHAEPVPAGMPGAEALADPSAPGEAPTPEAHAQATPEQALAETPGADAPGAPSASAEALVPEAPVDPAAADAAPEADVQSEPVPAGDASGDPSAAGELPASEVEAQAPVDPAAADAAPVPEADAQSAPVPAEDAPGDQAATGDIPASDADAQSPADLAAADAAPVPEADVQAEPALAGDASGDPSAAGEIPASEAEAQSVAAADAAPVPEADVQSEPAPAGDAPGDPAAEGEIPASDADAQVPVDPAAADAAPVPEADAQSAPAPAGDTSGAPAAAGENPAPEAEAQSPTDPAAADAAPVPEADVQAEPAPAETPGAEAPGDPSVAGEGPASEPDGQAPVDPAVADAAPDADVQADSAAAEDAAASEADAQPAPVAGEVPASEAEAQSPADSAVADEADAPAEPQAEPAPAEAAGAEAPGDPAAVPEADAQAEPVPAEEAAGDPSASGEVPAPEAEAQPPAAEPQAPEGEATASEMPAEVPAPQNEAVDAEASETEADAVEPSDTEATAPEDEATEAATDARADAQNAAEGEGAEASGEQENGDKEDADDAEPESEPVGIGVGPRADAGYDDAERAAVHRVMRERRDIRNGFRPDPIPHEVLRRVLEAAHTAPSVGQSQPWDFVVIRSEETRRTMHELAVRQRDAYAKSLPKGRAKQFKELKIEAILETPINIVVTADPTRGGRHTLGRHTQPQMAPYSSALAVENLWLAARAEGLGVGWVSFFDEREMVRTLGLPDHLEAVAYLCVGYVDEFPEEPELLRAGWSKRRPLSWVVHEETYGRRALPGEDPHSLLTETLQGIRPLDAKALGEAWERQKRMTKPSGALGMLEIISAQLSGLSRQCPPPIPEPASVAIFAGDHGVHAQGVTAWPQEVTAQMVANFLGGGAVCNAFASQVGAEVCVVDVGVASELPSTPGLLPRKIRPGTGDFTTGPALTREEVLRALEVGIETARDLVAAGNKALLTGEMGIANTTTSAALVSVYTGADPAEVTGRGTGINDEMHARKIDVVRRGLELHQPDPADPIAVLCAFGGLEHAAMAGLLLGGASLRTPVILDGVSAGAAALVARAIAPEVLAACIAGHRSAEPGHVAALNKLGLRPLVDLDLRLGEGTGALLALPVVQSAARAMHEVATFDSAGVTEKN